MHKDIMGTPTLYQFENIEIYGAEKPDDYLTHLYGDWRKLPLKKKGFHIMTLFIAISTNHILQKNNCCYNANLQYDH